MLDMIDDVVDRAGQRVDVRPVEGRDVLRVEQLDDRVGEAVALGLERLDVRPGDRAIGEAAEELLRRAGRLQRVRAGPRFRGRLEPVFLPIGAAATRRPRRMAADQWQLPVPESVKLPPASGTNVQS